MNCLLIVVFVLMVPFLKAIVPRVRLEAYSLLLNKT